MIRVVLLTIISVLLVGCRAEVSNDMLAESGNIHRVNHSRIQVRVNELDLSVRLPARWEYYATEFGVVLTEKINMAASTDQLGGLLMHVFVHPLNDLSVSIVADGNMAHSILDSIVHNPTYIGDALVGPVHAFDWGGHDAAYYLMDNGQGSRAIVFAIQTDRSHNLIFCHVSAPVDQTVRIREVLPELLDGLEVNGVFLDPAVLNAILPDELVFPQPGDPL